MELNPRLASGDGPSNTSGLNVTIHRAPVSVWDRRGWNGSHLHATVTRWLIGGGGLALAVQGLRHRGVARAMLAGIGGTLAWWAMTGEGELPDAQRWAAVLAEKISGLSEDPVHEASADSFPASDAPSFTPTVGTGVRHGIH
ncbi:MAG TPA: hypothetical protein VIW45_14665 [Vicinamibacterales bacterium]|jgi:hypothetical protein